MIYPNPSLEDPRPVIRNLQSTHNQNEINNGDEIIAIKTGMRSIKGYGDRTHMWDMWDMHRIKASCVMKKSGAWMLVRRSGPPGSKSLPKTPQIINGHVIRGDIRKTIIKIHGAHRAKLVQKKNTMP